MKKIVLLTLIILGVCVFSVILQCIIDPEITAFTIFCSIIYSIIAGLLVYLFTVTLPDYYIRKRFKPIVSNLYTEIIGRFADILSFVENKKDPAFREGSERQLNLMINLIKSCSGKQLIEKSLEILLNYFIEKDNKESKLLIENINQRVDNLKKECDSLLMGNRGLSEKQISQIIEIRNLYFWDLFGYFINLCIYCDDFYKPDAEQTKEEFIDLFRNRYTIVVEEYWKELQQTVKNIDSNQKYFN